MTVFFKCIFPNVDQVDVQMAPSSATHVRMAGTEIMKRFSQSSSNSSANSLSSTGILRRSGSKETASEQPIKRVAWVESATLGCSQSISTDLCFVRNVHMSPSDSTQIMVDQKARSFDSFLDNAVKTNIDSVDKRAPIRFTKSRAPTPRQLELADCLGERICVQNRKQAGRRNASSIP